jgi:hypothetical protein
MNQFKTFFKELFTEAESFQAKSKETGKLVNFKSKASMDAALKAGSHETPNAPKGGKAGDTDSKKDVPKVNIFDKPKADTSTAPAIKHTKVGPDSAEVQTIAKYAGVREKFLADFINQHKLDATAVANFVEKGSKEDRKDFFTAAVGNPGNKYEKKIIDKFGEKGDNKEEPTSQPKQQRKGNPQVNIAAKKAAEEAGITPQKLGGEYKDTMLKAAVEALTDANFHDEARELVAKLEGKPEWANRVNYPSMDDPNFKEKMADIRTNGVDSSEYWKGDNNSHEFGRKVSQESGWDGVDAADGIAFTLRMNGFHKEADAIQSIFDDKPYMKESGPLKLGKLVKESKRIKLIKEDIRRVKLLGIDFKVSEMNGRIFFSFVDKKAATIQLRQVGTNKIVNHIQNRLDIAFGKREFFFKSGDHAEFQNGYLFQRNTSDINLNKIKFESVDIEKFLLQKQK